MCSSGMGRTSEPGGHPLPFILPASFPPLLSNSFSAALCSCLLTGPLHLVSLIQPICHIPANLRAALLLETLEQTHCPQDGTPFISTLMTLSCLLRSMLSLTELPAVSTIGHVPSRLRTWLMLHSPFSTCLHSQFLVGSTPPGRPPAMRRQ